MAKVKIGVIFGGSSEEHPISVKSATQVAASLDAEKYEPYWIGITREGAWIHCDGPAPGWEESGSPAILSPDRGVHGVLVHGANGYEPVRLDVVFPVLHGRFGEDGTMQGLLELAGIPYVGCDVQSSAICMDKSLAYMIASHAGIPTPKFWVVQPGETVDASEFEYPVFVKPARSGSSFGVSKVTGFDELEAAVAEARKYDAKVLIEGAVVGSEVGCAVMGTGSDLFAGEVDQINLTHGFFRIHQEKTPETGSENSTFIVPADVPLETRDRVRATAKAIYTALGCGGLARVDMFLTPDGEFILNEVNTLPGMTSYSRYPRMMAAADVPLSEVIDRVVGFALAADAR